MAQNYAWFKDMLQATFRPSIKFGIMRATCNILVVADLIKLSLTSVCPLPKKGSVKTALSRPQGHMWVPVPRYA